MAQVDKRELDEAYAAIFLQNEAGRMILADLRARFWDILVFNPDIHVMCCSEGQRQMFDYIQERIIAGLNQNPQEVKVKS